MNMFGMLWMIKPLVLINLKTESFGDYQLGWVLDISKKIILQWCFLCRKNKQVRKCQLLSHVQLCNPVDHTVHGILQARILEWGVFPFSRESSRPRNWTRLSCTAGRFFTTELSGKPYTSLFYWKKKHILSSPRHKHFCVLLLPSP